MERMGEIKSDNNSIREEMDGKANIVVIGCGWWSQGWHIPQLSRNPRVRLVALIDTSAAPKSNLNPELLVMSDLSARYGNIPVYRSLQSFFDDSSVSCSFDGAIIATPHSSHFSVGEALLREGIRRVESGGSPISILMEKPMTTDVSQAKKLHEIVEQYQQYLQAQQYSQSLQYSQSQQSQQCDGQRLCLTVDRFFVNHSANHRPQATIARDAVRAGRIGRLRHVAASFASPLQWIFDDPTNVGWNEVDPHSPGMIGNGFAWGQSSHILAWIFYVCGDGTPGSALLPQEVFCTMNHSEITGADVSHAAAFVCQGGVTFSMTGTSLLPGYEHSNPRVAKEIRIEIYGSEGAILYSGNDCDVASGCLELRVGHTGETIVLHPQFQFEDLEQEGIGPASLQTFVNSCLVISNNMDSTDYTQTSNNVIANANSFIGLQTVLSIDAMYRSNKSKQVEPIQK